MEDIFIKFFNPYSKLDISFAKNIFTQPFSTLDHPGSARNNIQRITKDVNTTAATLHNSINATRAVTVHPNLVVKQLMHAGSSNLERPHVSVVLIEHGMSIEHVLKSV